jgi:cytoskeletal protein CcmA (bactofilin family)
MNWLKQLGLNAGLIEQVPIITQEIAQAIPILTIPHGDMLVGITYTSADVLIEGEVRGSVIAPDAKVTVAKGGRLTNGVIHAREIHWLGEVSDCSMVCEKLSVMPSARSNDAARPVRVSYVSIDMSDIKDVDIHMSRVAYTGEDLFGVATVPHPPLLPKKQAQPETTD